MQISKHEVVEDFFLTSKDDHDILKIKITVYNVRIL